MGFHFPLLRIMNWNNRVWDYVANCFVLFKGGGHYLRYMEGMFRANGGCGYVKKPNILLNVNDIFDPKALRPVKTTLQVKNKTGGAGSKNLCFFLCCFWNGFYPIKFDKAGFGIHGWWVAFRFQPNAFWLLFSSWLPCTGNTFHQLRCSDILINGVFRVRYVLCFVSDMYWTLTFVLYLLDILC